VYSPSFGASASFAFAQTNPQGSTVRGDSEGAIADYTAAIELPNAPAPFRRGGRASSRQT